MEQRITRSTLAGGRVESADRGLASPAKQTPIPRSESFTKVCSVLSKGRTGLGKAWLAGLRWQGDRAAVDTPCTGKRRRVWATVKVKVPGRFIGAGADHGADLALARRGARGGARGRALASSERVEHVALCFCPCYSLC